MHSYGLDVRGKRTEGRPLGLDAVSLLAGLSGDSSWGNLRKVSFREKCPTQSSPGQVRCAVPIRHLGSISGKRLVPECPTRGSSRTGGVGRVPECRLCLPERQWDARRMEAREPRSSRREELGSK